MRGRLVLCIGRRNHVSPFRAAPTLFVRALAGEVGAEFSASHLLRASCPPHVVGTGSGASKAAGTPHPSLNRLWET
jgi:hypothetical protein